MISGIHHIAIHTPNMSRLRTFYEHAFGFEAVGEEADIDNDPILATITGVEGAASRALIMKAGNCFIELFQWSAPKGRPLQPLNPNDFGYTHFCVQVVDIEAEYKRLSDLGMRFVHSMPIPYGPYGSVYGRDPDGNVIEILEAPVGTPLHLAAHDASFLAASVPSG